MNWHYNIVKQGKNYYVGEIVGDDSWVLYNDTISDSPQELIKDLTNKLLDCSHYPILEVKNNKIYDTKRKHNKSNRAS
jgi:hypothetical protein